MRVFSFICLLWLAACGFEPVHSARTHSDGDTAGALEDVQVVVPTGSRIGQLYRIALEDTLHPANEFPTPRYRLTATIEEINQPIIIERDASITRYNLILKTQYSLIDLSNGKVLGKKSGQRISSYNVSDSDFATFVAERDSRERGIRDLARSVSNELASLLKEPQS